MNKLPNGCRLPFTSRIGSFAALSSSALDGSLFETSISPLKSPFGPEGFVVESISDFSVSVPWESAENLDLVAMIPVCE